MSMETYFDRNPVLLYIGKKLVEDVLDKTNECFISEVSNPSTNIIRKKLECFSEEQLNVLQEMIPWITIGAFSDMMWMFEQNEEIQLIVDYKGEKINISEVSDGCEGDMDGWIERFGRYRDFVSIEEKKRSKQEYGNWLNSFNEWLKHC